MEVLQRTANRGSISTGYDIDNSCKFEADNSEYLKWTNISSYATSARKKTFSFSVWFKITETGVQRTIWANQANGYLLLQADGQLKWQQSYGGVVKTLNTNRLFRDTSAWYNVIIAVDTTQSTESNRQRLYVNGVEETSLTSTTYPSQNDEADNIYEGFHSLGAYNASSIFWSGYMANVAFISDAQITPSDVGEFDEDSGIWIPKEYSGGSAPSYFLEFKDSSDLGTATGLDADTLNNITAADQATDTPTNNFATLNPLMANAGSSNYLPITEGGTKAVNTAAAYKIANSTFGVTSGKWYWEVKATDVNGVTAIGVTMPHYWDTDYSLGGCIILSDGRRYNNSSATSGVTNTYTDGDIIGFALDMDATPPTLQVYKNNTSEANLMNGLSINGTGGAFLPVKEDGYFPKIVGYNANTFECNFGGYTSYTISSAASDENGYGTFEYAPPSGYYALCGKNLAEFGGTA